MQPNIANPLADFSQKRPVETPLITASRLNSPLKTMNARKLKLPGAAPVLVLLSMLLAPAALAQIIPHFHLAAGAASTAPGSQLQFNAANDFLADSGYAAVMTLRTNPPTVGYYMGGPTFTAAEGDGTEGPPAANGAQLWLVVRAVDGPGGGNWSYWEAGPDEEYGTSITFSYAAGTTNGTNAFILSQLNFQPNPYGHIHGRAFTADKPGLYTVWMQIIDRSRSGPGGGPLHAPSPIYRFYFQAGTTIARLAKSPFQVTATFATLNSNVVRQYTYYLEAAPTLEADTLWTTVAGPLRSNNRLRTLTAPVEPDAPATFYRLRVTSP